MEQKDKLEDGGTGSTKADTDIYDNTIGSGSAGTSYSGGSGSGAAYGTYSSGTRTQNAGANGGAGSAAHSDHRYSCGGGAGNPGGTGMFGGNGTTGIGGLLIVYSNNIINSGTISSNGSNGGTGTYGGGSSGGGSVNIFFRNSYDADGIVEANGGQSIGNSVKGGAGGDGTVSIGCVATGTYTVYDDVAISNESLLRKIRKLTTPGEQMIGVRYEAENGEKTNIIYNINLIIYDGDLVLDGKKEVEGATLHENVYEFGDKTNDVATQTTNAKNMVILKVNGNLTVNDGVTLTACKSDDGYGGPKGLTVYCKGTLINNGEITMTERGAKAVGENIYLWKNEKHEDQEGKYEYVPAVGGAGGAGFLAGRTQAGSGYLRNGNRGKNGTKRQTGGRRDRFK